ncbi:MAG: hypothetical protein ACK56I_33755, partial [bacterium]
MRERGPGDEGHRRTAPPGEIGGAQHGQRQRHGLQPTEPPGVERQHGAKGQRHRHGEQRERLRGLPAGVPADAGGEEPHRQCQPDEPQAQAGQHHLGQRRRWHELAREAHGHEEGRPHHG